MNQYSQALRRVYTTGEVPWCVAIVLTPRSLPTVLRVRFKCSPAAEQVPLGLNGLPRPGRNHRRGLFLSTYLTPTPKHITPSPSSDTHLPNKFCSEHERVGIFLCPSFFLKNCLKGLCMFIYRWSPALQRGGEKRGEGVAGGKLALFSLLNPM